MECPVELWDEQPGRPGRVDEQKLSMVRNIRAYLHEHLYRPATLYQVRVVKSCILSSRL
jgi:hypothetical protein